MNQEEERLLNDNTVDTYQLPEYPTPSTNSYLKRKIMNTIQKLNTQKFTFHIDKKPVYQLGEDLVFGIQIKNNFMSDRFSSAIDNQAQQQQTFDLKVQLKGKEIATWNDKTTKQNINAKKVFLMNQVYDSTIQLQNGVANMELSVKLPLDLPISFYNSDHKSFSTVQYTIKAELVKQEQNGGQKQKFKQTVQICEGKRDESKEFLICKSNQILYNVKALGFFNLGNVKLHCELNKIQYNQKEQMRLSYLIDTQDCLVMPTQLKVQIVQKIQLSFDGKELEYENSLYHENLELMASEEKKIERVHFIDLKKVYKDDLVSSITGYQLNRGDKSFTRWLSYSVDGQIVKCQYFIRTKMTFFLIGNELRSKSNLTTPILEVPFKIVAEPQPISSRHSAKLQDVDKLFVDDKVAGRWSHQIPSRQNWKQNDKYLEEDNHLINQ